MEYIESDAPKPRCIFCELPESPDAKAALVLAADDDCVVMMNRFPYNNGHLMVAPRLHTADIAAIETGAFQRLMESLRRTMGIVDEVLSPDGMNVGLNVGTAGGAGIADHLHWHIVPRWIGDTNFMPAIAETKVMPQHLEASYDLFRPHF
ncbi:MAG: HIT domain-containing protein [Deltaproteobacteria bacterium]